jgi:predicted nucleic acid-binding protein
VKQWILTPPNWLEIVPTANQYDLPMLSNLDVGERDAILLAVELKADLVIVDEREGVEEATRLGLRVTGTRGAERDLLDLSIVLRRLRATNFRVSPALLDRLLADDARRKRKLE